jgi:hypothetical protein
MIQQNLAAFSRFLVLWKDEPNGMIFSFISLKRLIKCGMGKKKSFYKKQLKPFLKGNSTWVAVLSGMASGLAIARILGPEKEKQIVQSVEDTVKDLNSIDERRIFRAGAS